MIDCNLVIFVLLFIDIFYFIFEFYLFICVYFSFFDNMDECKLILFVGSFFDNND